MIYKVETQIGGRVFRIETGKMAKLANGAAVVSYGDSVVLTTVVLGDPRKGDSGEDEDVLPLTVEYREKISAVGKIPGGFYKREGRPTVEEILTMRLIDRPLRPLFPKDFPNEIQIISLVLSAEGDFDPDILAMNGASAALMVSDIPFNGPIGAVRLGRRNGRFLVNPTLSELKESDLDIIVAGTTEGVIMVEGQAKELSEEILIEAIQFAHEALQPIIEIQRNLATQVNKQCIKYSPNEIDKQLYEIVRQEIAQEYREKLQITLKQQRRAALNQIKENFIAKYCANLSEEEKITQRNTLKKIFTQIEREIVRELILQGKRLDGRRLDEIRPISCEVGVLPRTHGSALFTRGETQALVVATLGTAEDEQIIDGLTEEYSIKFMLHYNFPPFSVGEVKPIRGPSRREIGHGHLAERAISPVLPPPEKFPYTIRVVSDILESNGSTCMATVCGASLCLMDAGVPIKSPVAGIAMGLVKEGEKIQILSDILGNEDRYGDMDFKIAGTVNGITAIQMDIKIEGISTSIMQQVLSQAKKGRFFILEKMLATLPKPRAEVSVYAPKLVRITVNPDKLGLIIGSGGRTIRKLEEETKVTIELKNNGEIYISSLDPEAVEKARQEIEKLTEEVEIGKIYQGKVVGIRDFGAFVEVLPGQEGLVHISELSDGFVRNVEDIVKIGQIIPVKVIGIDELNRIKLSYKQAMASLKKSTEVSSSFPKGEKFHRMGSSNFEDFHSREPHTGYPRGFPGNQGRFPFGKRDK